MRDGAYIVHKGGRGVGGGGGVKGLEKLSFSHRRVGGSGEEESMHSCTIIEE